MTMDVDLLRPGTVPISPDTVLWFEFLLNPSLLEKHISKPSPDPSPTDLIIKFITINMEQTNEQNNAKVVEIDCNDAKVNSLPKWSYKNIALKVLSLKVAAFLKWDLDLLLQKLPLHILVVLLQDLFYITMNTIIEIPTLPESLLDISSDRVLFTLVLYHRWVLKAIVNRALNHKQAKPFPHTNAAMQENHFATSMMNDELIRKLDLQAANSIHFLNAVLQVKDLKPKILKFETFRILTEDTTEIKQDWANVYTITEDELKCQIHYDLALFHLLKEENKLAQNHIIQAKELYTKLDTLKPLLYCRIEKEYLEGYCLACEVSVEGKGPNLTDRLFRSIKNQYANIIEILQADNLSREISITHRDILELDIEGGTANRKIVVASDLLLQIQCLNLVRRVLDNEVLIGNYAFYIKSAGAKGLEVLFWAFDGVLEKATDLDKKRIARCFLYLIIMGDINGLACAILANPKYISLFNEKELKEIKKEAEPEELDIPSILLNDDWGIEPVKFTSKQTIDLHHLEQRLITSYDPREIEHLLKQIMQDNPKYPKPLWQLHSAWEIPIPLQSVISSMPQGFLRDFSYILLAKSKDLALLKNFGKAKMLIKIVENEVQRHASTLNEACHKSSLLGGNNMVYKLTRLISWESLLTEICHCLYAWPPHNICDKDALVAQCKQCLNSSIQSSDQLIPRQEIIEHCTVFLLNMTEWDYLTSIEKPWSCLEFAAALCNVMKHKNQKFPKEAWDMVLSACKHRDIAQKRSNSNRESSNNNASRDSLTSISSILYRLREATVLNITISLLARLHNLLRDETFELHFAFLNLWPASITNHKAYNPKIISEILIQLLTIAFKYYPTNVSWLRLMADLNFVLGHHESAMKYYLETIIVATDFFTLPIRNHIDDSVFKRMIKCCTHLQCFTQAVVLCQFLDEVDYALAFKMAGNESKNVALNDAMDAYYNCIWDTTILEYLINLHAKRGEHHRKQLAIKNIGLLELNSNNNEEIQREAANIRKAKFLRALSKQYVYNF